MGCSLLSATPLTLTIGRRRTLRVRRRQWPQRRRSGGYWRSSASACSARPLALFEPAPVCPARLLNHLICQEKQGWGYRHPECLGGLEVDDQFELRGLLHGQVGGLAPLQDAIHIVGGAPVHVTTTRRIGHETAGFGKYSVPVDRRQPTLGDEVDKPCAVIKGDR